MDDVTVTAGPALAVDTSSAVGTIELSLEVVAGPHKGRSSTFPEHDSFIVGRAVKLISGYRRRTNTSLGTTSSSSSMPLTAG